MMPILRPAVFPLVLGLASTALLSGRETVCALRLRALAPGAGGAEPAAPGRGHTEPAAPGRGHTGARAISPCSSAADVLDLCAAELRTDAGPARDPSDPLGAVGRTGKKEFRDGEEDGEDGFPTASWRWELALRMVRGEDHPRPRDPPARRGALLRQRLERATIYPAPESAAAPAVADATRQAPQRHRAPPSLCALFWRSCEIAFADEPAFARGSLVCDASGRLTGTVEEVDPVSGELVVRWGADVAGAIGSDGAPAGRTAADREAGAPDAAKNANLRHTNRLNSASAGSRCEMFCHMVKVGMSQRARRELSRELDAKV